MVLVTLEITGIFLRKIVNRGPEVAISARPRKTNAFIGIVALCVMVLKSVGCAAETPDTLLSGSIDAAARTSSLPPEILIRLLWVESRFHPAAVSPAGAQGIAQFMPATAAERGLINPFAPAQAIPQAARLLADLTFRFGNLGLGLAAYNAGAGRTARWLDDAGPLPSETRQFVTAITGRSPEEWAASGRSETHGRGLIGCQYCAMGRNLGIQQLGIKHAVMLPILARSGIPLPILEGRGRPLPILEGSGRPLPVLQGSGRPLPTLQQSGKPPSGTRTPG
jgi:hypothetical protein